MNAYLACPTEVPRGNPDSRMELKSPAAFVSLWPPATAYCKPLYSYSITFRYRRSASGEPKRGRGFKSVCVGCSVCIWTATLKTNKEVILAALDTLGQPQEQEVLVLGDHVEGLIETWSCGTREERRDILRMMLEAVYVDVPKGIVVALQVSPGGSFRASAIVR